MQAVRHAGFTLIELISVVMLVAILTSIAVPSYLQYAIRASRQAAQSELLDIANLQEKIYLHSSAFAASLAGTYDGTSAGGLGLATAQSEDGRYALTMTVKSEGQAFELRAEPVPGKSQQGDGGLVLLSNGSRGWCKGGGSDCSHAW